MFYYLIAIAIIPFLGFMIYFLYIEIKIIKGSIIIKKVGRINQDNYNKIILNVIQTDYKLPRGQVAFNEFELKYTYKAQSQRMYTGDTKSGIKMPFFTLAFQKKRFYQLGGYIQHGPSKITITNKYIRLQGYKIPFKWKYRILDIEELSLVDDGKTVYLGLKEKAWPNKLVFKNTKEAVLFINICWTIYNFGPLIIRKGDVLWD